MNSSYQSIIVQKTQSPPSPFSSKKKIILVFIDNFEATTKFMVDGNPPMSLFCYFCF